MGKYLLIQFIFLLVFCQTSAGFFALDLQAESADDRLAMLEDRPLAQLLEDFGERYQVFFSYENSILDEIDVDFEFRKDEPMEAAIARLMAKTNLSYESFQDKYLVIYEESWAARRNARRIMKKFDQIEKLQANMPVIVQNRSEDRSQNLTGVVEAVADLKTKEVKAPRRENFAGIVRGQVTDMASGEPLAYASVFLQGTTIGTATDLEGFYRITGVPTGPQILVVSYTGYGADSMNINLTDGQELEVNFELAPGALLSDEIVVSAQRSGQAAAINQQVRSNKIVNVVSADRIQELPDENAAESVGRLPGVSVRRSGGEGQRVNIRGLSPKFSPITVDGVQIPPTGQGRAVFQLARGQGQGTASPQVDDRSVDLSMISSEALAGIEVYKSNTPDQDGDAIGGRVNFLTRRAPRGTRYFVNVLGGYNFYHRSYNNFKINGSVSSRFFDNKLGVIAGGGYNQIDRSVHSDNVEYTLLGEVFLQGLTLRDQQSLRRRYNGSLVLDYEFNPNHKLIFNSMYARTDINTDTRQLRINSRTNSGQWSANQNESNINLTNFSLTGDHDFNFLELDWKGTFIQTQDENPFSYGFGFQDNNPLANNEIPLIDPYRTAEFTEFDPDDAVGGVPGGGDITERIDQNIVATVDLKKSYQIGNRISGFVKVGGKLWLKDRTRTRTNGTIIRGDEYLTAYRNDNPEAVYTRNGIAATNHLDPDYEQREFFNGTYPFPILLDTEAPKQLFDRYASLRFENLLPGTGDYEVQENIYAGYIMTDVNLGPRINFVGGVRYEHSDNEYFAYELDNYGENIVGDEVQTQGEATWQRSAQNFGIWLPMANVKFNILRNDDNSNGMDLRLAATRAITRPDFYNLTPFISIQSAGNTLERSEPNLQPTKAWNYDAFLTLFNNKFGLFTLGGFYKTLDNIDFIYGRRLSTPETIERFGEQYGLSNAFQVIEPINATERTYVYGFEVELQTSLSFLPSPFDGIVIYGNYSRIWSEAEYPLRLSIFNPETFRSTLVDTTRSGPMPGQSDHIANISLGYDKGFFSGRVTWSYQGPALDFLGPNEDLDGYIDAISRIDLSFKFEINKTVAILANVTNVTNQYDRTFTGSDRLPGSSFIYGAIGWLGIRLTGNFD